MSNSISVFAPASIGNVGCGFDVLGLCLENPGDEIEIWKTETPGVKIESITGDNGILSLDADKNTAAIPMIHFLKNVPQTHGVAFKLHKKMPFGSGLGSSAASAVAGAFAINALFGEPLSREALLPLALEGEKFASKSVHADNVAPSLLGGLVLARGNEPFEVIKLESPKELRIVLIYPHVEINTSEARKIIPHEIPLKKAIYQWGNVAALVAGMAKSDFGLIGRSIEDVIIEPHRAQLIPHFFEMRTAAMEAGALGFSISGSGPTCFALTHNVFLAEQIAAAMGKVLADKKIKFTIFQSKVNTVGPKIISR